MHTFDRPVPCFVCGKLLRGIFYQGYICQNYQLPCHKACITKTAKITQSDAQQLRRRGFSFHINYALKVCLHFLILDSTIAFSWNTASCIKVFESNSVRPKISRILAAFLAKHGGLCLLLVFSAIPNLLCYLHCFCTTSISINNVIM